MQLTLNRITSIILGATFALLMLATPALVSAQAISTSPQINDNLCGGAGTLQFGNNSSSSCQTNTQNAEKKVNDLVGQIINIFSIIVGIVAVIMIVYGGFRYITSGGDSGNVTSAKNTILSAIIGLVIVALAQFIVKFVLSKVSA